MQVLTVLSCLLAAAMARPGFLGAAPGLLGAGYAGPAAYGGYAGAHHFAPANIVIGPGGVPFDTPEVAAARKAHLTYVAETRARDAAVNAADAASGAAYAGYAGAAYAGAAAAGYAGAGVYGPAGLGYAGAGLAAPSILALKAGHHLG
ncbi:cuticle protein 18.7-like [Schistocerca americana]|uniref:cuticle protein 18.7-like n=1 Tax=Schistocerca americana TaxID=7009 RepID=UPI001F4F61E2|nr:cuticle protein 18.7-like [Schistocerca americana]